VAVRFIRPHCNHAFDIGYDFVGPRAFCPRCGQAITILRPVKLETKLRGFSSPSAPAPHYAGFWIRLMANLLDGVILLVPTTIAEAVLPALGGFVLWVAYKGLCLANWNGQTIGKKACGIRVVDVSLRPCTTGQAFGRTFAELLSMITLFIGYLMVGFDARKQALHDKCAGTLHVYA
jgi:uncharacterized RDD family membrane protein YckC